MSTSFQTVTGVAFELLFTVLALGLVYRLFGKALALPERRTVLPFQRGVVLKGEDVRKVLVPGTFWISPKRTLLLCDMRPKPFQVPGLELMSVDRKSVRVSLGESTASRIPQSSLPKVPMLFGAFYLEIRKALHAAVGALPGQAFLDGDALLALRVKELLVARSSQLGIEMTKLEIWEAVPLGLIRLTEEDVAIQ